MNILKISTFTTFLIGGVGISWAAFADNPCGSQLNTHGTPSTEACCSYVSNGRAIWQDGQCWSELADGSWPAVKWQGIIASPNNQKTACGSSDKIKIVGNTRRVAPGNRPLSLSHNRT